MGNKMKKKALNSGSQIRRVINRPDIDEVLNTFPDLVEEDNFFLSYDPDDDDSPYILMMTERTVGGQEVYAWVSLEALMTYPVSEYKTYDTVQDAIDAELDDDEGDADETAQVYEFNGLPMLFLFCIEKGWISQWGAAQRAMGQMYEKE